MTRYMLMYAAWLAGVLTMAAVAVAWYKHVEEIGLQELGDRLTQTPATGDTEDTETES